MTPTLKTTLTMSMCEMISRAGELNRTEAVREVVEELERIIKHREDALKAEIEVRKADQKALDTEVLRLLEVINAPKNDAPF